MSNITQDKPTQRKNLFPARKIVKLREEKKKEEREKLKKNKRWKFSINLM